MNSAAFSAETRVMDEGAEATGRAARFQPFYFLRPRQPLLVPARALPRQSLCHC